MKSQRTVYVVAALLAAAQAPAQFTFTQVALTGDPAPGAADSAEFDFLSSPALNDAGDVSFVAVLQTGGGPPVTLSNASALVGPSAGSGSAIAILAREGDAAPGAADAAEFDVFSTDSLTSVGDVGFVARLRTGAGAPVTSSNDTAFFGPTAGLGSALGLIAREGDPAPGAADNAELAGISLGGLNEGGDVAYDSLLRTGTGAPVTSDNNDAIFGPTAGAGSAIGVVVREGDPAPGAADSALYAGVTFAGLNDSGDVTLLAGLRTGAGAPVTASNDTAVFGPTAGAGSALGLLAREGETAPDAVDAAEFDLFLDSAINAGGDVGFVARLRTGAGATVTTLNDDAIYAPTGGPGSAIGQLAREGDPAPDATDGALLSSLALIPALALNDSADAAFVASLRTGSGAPVTSGNDAALYTSVDGQLRMVLREGDDVSVLPQGGPAEDRTIETIFFGKNGLNDNGVLAVSLTFTDGTSGVFTVAPQSIPGDFDMDGDVDVDDFGVFVNSFQLSPQGGPPFADGDFDEDGDVDVDDFGVFVNSFQLFPPSPGVAIPEPTGALLVLVGAVSGWRGRSRPRSRHHATDPARDTISFRLG